jgi:hypothetical protein
MNAEIFMPGHLGWLASRVPGESGGNELADDRSSRGILLVAQPRTRTTQSLAFDHSPGRRQLTQASTGSMTTDSRQRIGAPCFPRPNFGANSRLLGCASLGVLLDVGGAWANRGNHRPKIGDSDEGIWSRVMCLGT